MSVLIRLHSLSLSDDESDEGNDQRRPASTTPSTEPILCSCEGCYHTVDNKSDICLWCQQCSECHGCMIHFCSCETPGGYTSDPDLYSIRMSKMDAISTHAPRPRPYNLRPRNRDSESKSGSQSSTSSYGPIRRKYSRQTKVKRSRRSLTQRVTSAHFNLPSPTTLGPVLHQQILHNEAQMRILDEEVRKMARLLSVIAPGYKHPEHKHEPKD